MKERLFIRSDVAEALRAERPVIVLESTIIAHGLPRPQNVTVALQAEEEARSLGAVPATVGILEGRIVIGLDPGQIERLGTEEGVLKVSRRDFAYALAGGRTGATTVCGTMMAAHMAGIRIFATGGIGGVHRGHPFDVSADLLELGRTPVTVVCAGAKAILDLPLTLEVLETQGVPVIGYGTDEFPAFYSRSSGLPVDVCCDTPEEVAAIAQARDALELPGGILVAVPIPTEDELPSSEAETAIGRALAEAEAQGITGKAVTPFLLARVSELTGETSLRANVALLLNNARVAAAIAVAISA